MPPGLSCRGSNTIYRITTRLECFLDWINRGFSRKTNSTLKIICRLTLLCESLTILPVAFSTSEPKCRENWTAFLGLTNAVQQGDELSYPLRKLFRTRSNPSRMILSCSIFPSMQFVNRRFEKYGTCRFPASSSEPFSTDANCLTLKCRTDTNECSCLIDHRSLEELPRDECFKHGSMHRSTMKSNYSHWHALALLPSLLPVSAFLSVVCVTEYFRTTWINR